MNVQLAQARIKPEHVADVRAAAARVFTAIEAAQFPGVRFSWLVRDDDETFVVLAQADAGTRNPIPGLPEYRELVAGLEQWLAEPPDRQELTVVGSYRLF